MTKKKGKRKKEKERSRRQQLAPGMKLVSTDRRQGSVAVSMSEVLWQNINSCLVRRVTSCIGSCVCYRVGGILNGGC